MCIYARVLKAAVEITVSSAAGLSTHIDPTPRTTGTNKKIVETRRNSPKVPMRLTVRRPGPNI